MVTFGWAALAVAAARGHTDLVRILVAAVGDYNVPESLGFAVETESSDIPEILSHLLDSLSFIMDELLWIEALDLSRHPNLKVKDYSIWLAANRGHKEVVQALIQAGANVNIDEGYPLVTAAVHGHTEVVQLLLDAGAKHRKVLAFEVAAVNRYVGIAELLISDGVDVDEYFSEQSLKVVYTAGNGQIVHTLLDLGMDIHVDDDAPILWVKKNVRDDASFT
ncbi:hypothetical protein HK104_006951, partial [Borealophlyctis nickersoniae]